MEKEASCGSSNRIYRLCLTFSSCCCVFLTRFCTFSFFFSEIIIFNFSLIMSVSIFNKTCISLSLLSIYNYEMILFLVLQYCHPQYIQRLYSFVPCVVFTVTRAIAFLLVLHSHKNPFEVQCFLYLYVWMLVLNIPVFVISCSC